MNNYRAITKEQYSQLSILNTHRSLFELNILEYITWKHELGVANNVFMTAVKTSQIKEVTQI